MDAITKPSTIRWVWVLIGALIITLLVIAGYRKLSHCCDAESE